MLILSYLIYAACEEVVCCDDLIGNIQWIFHNFIFEIIASIVFSVGQPLVMNGVGKFNQNWMAPKERFPEPKSSEFRTFHCAKAHREMLGSGFRIFMNNHAIPAPHTGGCVRARTR